MFPCCVRKHKRSCLEQARLLLYILRIRPHIILAFCICICVGIVQTSTVSAHAGLDHAALGAITEHSAVYRADAISLIEKTTNSASLEARKTICEQSSQLLSEKIQASSLMAVSYTSKMDSIFTSAQQFYSKESLLIDGYQQQLEQVIAAQNIALIDTGVMAVLNRAIRCNGAYPFSDVVAFRMASVAARSSVDTYKNELTELLKMIKNSATQSVGQEGINP